MSLEIRESWEVELEALLPKARSLVLELGLHPEPLRVKLGGDTLYWYCTVQDDAQIQNRIAYWMKRLGRQCGSRVRACLRLSSPVCAQAMQGYAQGKAFRKILMDWWEALCWNPALEILVEEWVGFLPPNGVSVNELESWWQGRLAERITTLEGVAFVEEAMALEWLQDFCAGFGEESAEKPGFIAGLTPGGGPQGACAIPVPRIVRKHQRNQLVLAIIAGGIAFAVLAMAAYGVVATHRLVESLRTGPAVALEARWLDDPGSIVKSSLRSASLNHARLPPGFGFAMNASERIRQIHAQEVGHWYQQTRALVKNRITNCVDGHAPAVCHLSLPALQGMWLWLENGDGTVSVFQKRYRSVVRFLLWQEGAPDLEEPESQRILSMLEWVAPLRQNTSADSTVAAHLRAFAHKDLARAVLADGADSLPYWTDAVLAMAPSEAVAEKIARESYDARQRVLETCLLEQWGSVSDLRPSTDWGDGCVLEWQLLRGQLPASWKKRLGLPQPFFEWMSGLVSSPAMLGWNEMGDRYGWDIAQESVLDSLDVLAQGLRQDAGKGVDSLWESFYGRPLRVARQRIHDEKEKRWMARYCQDRSEWLSSLARTFPFGNKGSDPDADLATVRHWFAGKGRLAELVQWRSDSLADSGNARQWREFVAQSQRLIAFVRSMDSVPVVLSYKACPAANTEGQIRLGSLSKRLGAGDDCITGRYTWSLDSGLIELNSAVVENRPLRFMGTWGLQRLAATGMWYKGAGIKVELPVRSSGFRDLLTMEWTQAAGDPQFMQPTAWKLPWPASPFLDENNHSSWRRCHD